MSAALTDAVLAAFAAHDDDVEKPLPSRLPQRPAVAAECSPREAQTIAERLMDELVDAVESGETVACGITDLLAHLDAVRDLNARPPKARG